MRTTKYIVVVHYAMHTTKYIVVVHYAMRTTKYVVVVHYAYAYNKIHRFSHGSLEQITLEQITLSYMDFYKWFTW